MSTGPLERTLERISRDIYKLAVRVEKLEVQDRALTGDWHGSTHDPVSLDANADTILSLSTQVLGLDTQAANLIWAGPAAGAAAVPTFRALVAADMPGGVFWKLGGNAEGATVVGGTTDTNDVKLYLNGATVFWLDYNATSPNIVGGITGVISAGVVGAFLGGGGFAGNSNNVTDDYGVVCGGANNRAGDGAGTTSDKNYAFVGGGYTNRANGQYSVVCGGNTNTNSAYIGTICGGTANSIVSGANHAFVGGGNTNVISGTSQNAVIAGGTANTISATGSQNAILGGGSNTISGSTWYSTILAGYSNTISNYYSVASGYRANISHRGCFIYADEYAADYTSGANNEARFRASGGFYHHAWTSATTSTTSLLTITHNSTGTPGGGFGYGILWRLETTTTENTNAAKLEIYWGDATHATRKSGAVFYTADSTGFLEVYRAEKEELIINDAHRDYDFRVEGDTDTHLLFVNAGDERVGVSASSPKSTFEVGGSFGALHAAIASGDSPYSAGDETVIIVDATGGDVTVNLPAVANVTGRIYHIKRIDGSANNVTIDGNGAETIDDSATQPLAAQYDTLTVFCDGAEWWII